MCGDGMLDPMEGEQCDDGNQDTTDSCVGECGWMGRRADGLVGSGCVMME